MDIGPSSQRRMTSRKRVSSPKAANRGAEPRGSAAFELRRLGKILLNQRYHHCPTLFVGRERLRAARQRNLVEARFRDGQRDAISRFLQSENHQSCRPRGVVDAGLNSAGMPPEGEQLLGLHLLDGDVKWDACVLFLRIGHLRIDRGGHDYSVHDGAWFERSIEL